MEPTCNFCGAPGNFSHQAGTCTGCINAINHLRSHGFRVDKLDDHSWHIALPTPRFTTNGLTVTTVLPHGADTTPPPPVIHDFTSLESLLEYIITATNPGGTNATH